MNLPPNWSIVECPRCGDPVFAELGAIRLHADSSGVHKCSGTGWMIRVERGAETPERSEGVSRRED